MKQIRKGTLIALLAAVFPACHACEHQTLETGAEWDVGSPWKRIIPGQDHLGAEPLAPGSFAWVPELAQAEAQALLVNAPWVAVPEADAERFGGKLLNPESGNQGVLVLLRGVQTEVRKQDQSLAQNDKLQLDWLPDRVHVLHLTSRHGLGARERNRAVIAILPSAPEEVWPMAMAVIFDCGRGL
ncbi:MAG: hypothetical protein R3F33_07680 [Planctomycetota bacterium]